MSAEKNNVDANDGQQPRGNDRKFIRPPKASISTWGSAVVSSQPASIVSLDRAGQFKSREALAI